MLSITKSRFAGKKSAYWKYCLMIVSLVLVSIQIQAQNGWTQKANIPTPRAGATASVINDTIFLIGGWLNNTHSPINGMYDPSTNTWEVKAPMPTARGFLSSAVVNDTIYTIGGGYPTSTNKNEAYDPATNSWTIKANMNVARINGRAGVVNGIIYVIAGYPNERSCEAYNTQTNTWTSRSNFPESSGGVVSVAVYNGLVYAFGGGYYNGLKTVYAYNPQTDTWTKKSDMWTPRTVSQACLVNGKIYVIGGATSEYNPTDAVEMYNPATDTWYIKSHMPVPSAFLSCAVVNNKIYVFEGTPDWSGTTGGSKVWEYDPALDPVELPTPVELTSFTAEALDQKVILRWTTATELNNHGFEIQRKIVGTDFATVGFKKGEGTTTNQKEYSYVDKNLADGKYFYRLKQVDFNGQYNFSKTVEVDVRSLDNFTLEQNYPNPFNPTTTIGYILKEKTATKLIFLNSIGEEVAVLVNEEQDKGYHKVEWNAENLSSGVYFYQLKAGSYVETKKMILLR
ncbi:MAG: hypothetical protein A2W11_03190 [Ignavibacteria bacterium RBG_16_35_7]|nr:MAG: hypothetical protein A2W11_03190 [Ignavibacteria bacterium RBG_16_35_7]